jgi:hypothetical protein
VIGLLFLLQAAPATGAIPVITPGVPSAARELTSPIPASAKAVVDHVDAIWKGDVKGALAFVADDVVVSVSDGTKTIKSFPPGKAVAEAMYLSMTRNGELGAAAMGCTPEPIYVRCTLGFGKGADTRYFTMRYSADGGPITQILSWEDHRKVAP